MQPNNQPNNPSAYPSQQLETLSGTWNQSYDPGMTLRDYFAGQALPAVMAAPATFVAHQNRTAPQMVAAAAYHIADAMLAERDRLTKEERGENAAQ